MISIVDRCINVVCDLDLMRIWCLNTAQFTQAELQQGVYCRLLNASDLIKISNIPAFNIGHHLLTDFSRYHFLAVGAFVHKKLVATSFFATGEVLARHNSVGQTYRGISVYLPPGTTFLFKAHVLKQYQGQGLFSAMVGFAIAEMGTDNIETVITKSSWSDKARAANLQRQGFKACTLAAELIWLGRHYFKLPPPFDPTTCKPVTQRGSVGKAIRFRTTATP
jgi:GNAT superfamily N-acetyltransferase